MKSSALEVIKLLSDGRFYSGELIGELLGVSRAAVWKRLQQLEELGLETESVKGKGYRLKQAVSLIDRESFRGFCAANHLPEPVIESITSSTNADLMAKASIEPEAFSMVIAEQQTQGRGRRGRTWVSPFASNLYFSMLASFENGAASLDGLSLLVGLSLQKVLQAYEVDAELKWPNDVLVSNKKIAGILLELSGDPTGLCHVVIGVGVNLNMHSGEGKIDQAWTSLSKECENNLINKTEFTQAFVIQLLEDIKIFTEQGFKAFHKAWSEVDGLKDKEVMVMQGNEVLLGNARGVNEKGELLLETNLGVEVLNGGEVSVRKKM